MASPATRQLHLPLGDSLGPIALPRPADTTAAGRPRVSAGRRALAWRKLAVRRPFLDAVERHCVERDTTASDLLDAVGRLFGPGVLAQIDDPGPPLPRDISVVWRPTRSGGMRRVRTVPRLRVKAPRNMDDEMVRKSLALALGLARGDVYDLLPRATVDSWHADWRKREADLANERDHARECLERLSFRPLEGGVRTAAQAARVLGLISEFGLRQT